ATPPSRCLAVLAAIRAGGVDAGFTVQQDGQRDWPARDRFPFHILAWTLESAGRDDDAVALCQWTAAAWPQAAFALSCLGEAYWKAGRHEEALATLLEADAKEPGE